MDTRKLAVPVGDDACSRRGTPTGLRGLTASPRLSLMRSRRDSSETTTSGLSSCSTESRIASSCVTRHTSSDDCDRHKFIVWTAVQRNNCEKMSPTEKLECPMLRCRRRCENHEMMLKHLYECKLLVTGEYWCYECEKPEMFTDANCKRCTGHPGRRRRMMSHAKNFFSSLGHRHRRDGTSSSPSDDDSLFDTARLGLLDGHGQQVELSSSTEIVEIDSTELFPSPTPPRDLDLGMMAGSNGEQAPMRSDIFGVSDDSQDAPIPVSPFSGLQTMSEQLLDWDANYPPAGPDDPIRVPSPASFQERPLLQLNTSALDQYSSQIQTDDAMLTGNQLFHSLSLRSNGSTATSNSYGISPASVHSGAWTMGSAWDTDMTSLSSGMVSPTGCLSRGGSNASRRSCFDSVHHPETIAELPAEMPGIQTTEHCNTSAVNIESMQDTPMGNPGLAAQTADPALLEALRNLDAMPIFSNDAISPCFDADTLVRKACKSLQVDVAESLVKLQPYVQNPLVSQLRTLGSQGIRSRGMLTIQQYLKGQSHAEAMDFLCCVFLLRALSDTIRHSDESRRHDLFSSICQFINPILSNSHKYALQIIQTLWSTSHPPPDVSLDLTNLPRDASNTTIPLEALEALLDSASLFIDHMEYAVVTFEPSSLGSSGSSLRVRHQDAFQEHHRYPANLQLLLLEHAAKIKDRFSHSFDLTTGVNEVENRIRRGQIWLARRAELEFLEIGKRSLPLGEYLDIYVPEVRHLCDASYQDTALDHSRHAFHEEGLAVIDSIMHRQTRDIPHTSQSATIAEPRLDDLVVGMIEPVIDDGDAVAFDDFLLDDPDSFDATMSLDGPSESPMVINATMPQVVITTKTEAPDTLDSSPGAQKVEAKESCKLCGFRPKGDPKWFRGSMAKHMKHQHSTQPPKIYKCPYPNCKSEYRNRPDNLRQHQLEKDHFVGGESGRRPIKRKKIDHPGAD